jgi:hypothetical protein
MSLFRQACGAGGGGWGEGLINLRLGINTLDHSGSPLLELTKFG